MTITYSIKTKYIIGFEGPVSGVISTQSQIYPIYDGNVQIASFSEQETTFFQITISLPHEIGQYSYQLYKKDGNTSTDCTHNIYKNWLCDTNALYFVVQLQISQKINSNNTVSYFLKVLPVKQTDINSKPITVSQDYSFIISVLNGTQYTDYSSSDTKLYNTLLPIDPIQIFDNVQDVITTLNRSIVFKPDIGKYSNSGNNICDVYYRLVVSVDVNINNLKYMGLSLQCPKGIQIYTRNGNITDTNKSLSGIVTYPKNLTNNIPYIIQDFILNPSLYQPNKDNLRYTLPGVYCFNNQSILQILPYNAQFNQISSIPGSQPTPAVLLSCNPSTPDNNSDTCSYNITNTSSFNNGFVIHLTNPMNNIDTQNYYGESTLLSAQSTDDNVYNFEMRNFNCT